MVLGDVYTIMIIRDLVSGPRRFVQLADAGINPRSLTERLKHLTEEGFVNRRPYAERPPRVEYALTDKGRALVPVLEALREFGERWMPGPDPKAAEPRD